MLTRGIETGSSVLLSVVMISTLVGDSIMVGHGSNEFVKFIFGMIIRVWTLDIGLTARHPQYIFKY